MSAFVQKACRRAPLDGALKLLEQRLWSQIHKLRREQRLKKLQSFSGTFVQHLYDKKQFGRLLSIKESSRIKRQIRLFTTLDSFQLYCRLLCDRSLFLRMAKGLALPDSIEQILDLAAYRLQQEQLCYQDALPLLYLHLCLFAPTAFRISARWWWMRRRIILRCISPSSKSCFRTPATPSWATATRPSKNWKPPSSIEILQICSRTSVPA